MDVVLGKRIRAQDDGTDVFDDYWTDTDHENSKLTNVSVATDHEEVATQYHNDISNVYERINDSEPSTMWRDKKNSKARRWLSASFAGSVKSFAKSITPGTMKDKAVNTSHDKSKRSANTSLRKDRHNVTFQLDSTNENLTLEGNRKINVPSRNVSKKFQTSENAENLNTNTFSSDSAEAKQIQRNNAEESHSDASSVERFPLIQRSILPGNATLITNSKEVPQWKIQTPEKRPLIENYINGSNEFAGFPSSSSKKRRPRMISDYDSDSSSEVSSKIEISKNKRHSSSAILPIQKSPQTERSLSYINKTVNTSVKRFQKHKTSTPKNISQKNNANKSAKQSLIKKSRMIVDYSSDSSSEKSPSDEETSRIERHLTSLVSRNKNISALDRQMHELQGHKNLFPSENDVNKLKFSEESPIKRKNRVSKNQQSDVNLENSPAKSKQSLIRQRNSRINVNEQSHLQLEKSLSKFEQSPVRRGRSRMSKDHLGPKKSPSKLGQSPVKRGRPRKSVDHLEPEESPSKLDQSPVRRGRPRLSVNHLESEESPSKFDQSRVRRGRPRLSVGQKNHLGLEKWPSKHGLSPDKSRVTADQRSGRSSKVEPSRNENDSTPVVDNDEGPLGIKQFSMKKKRNVDSSIRTSQKHLSQIHSDVFQFENGPPGLSSPERSPVKRKSSSRTIIQQSHPSLESKSPKSSGSKASPEKRIRRAAGNEIDYSRQDKAFAKVKTSRNKKATPADAVDNNRVQSEENSVSPVKGKEKNMTVMGNNKKHPRSKKLSKYHISLTQGKQSEDITSNVNTSGLANGLRRSSRYRVPPLDLWRNERLLFKTLASGEVQCVGIDKGVEEDRFGLLQVSKRKKISSKKNKLEKRTLEKTVKETKILDMKTNKIVHVHLHRPFDSLEWAVPPFENKENPPYIITKGFSSNCLSFGFLDVSPFSAKEEQFSPTDNLHFVVIKGTVDVTIHKTKFIFEKADSFIVPIGAPYSVKNRSQSRALLSFCTFRIPFYQYQFEE